jgi:hypothetical protein
VADVSAAVTVARERSADRKRERVAKERAREHGAGPEPRRKTDANGNAVFRGEGKRKSGGKKPADGTSGSKKLGQLGFAWSGNRKVLTAEYVLVIVIVGLGAMLSGDDQKDDVVYKALIKSSALSLLFFLLALLSSGGKGAAKTATAFGTLVTAAYAFTSSDVHNVLNWIGSFFSHEHKPSKSGSGSSGGSSSAAGGAAEDLGKAGADLLSQGADAILKQETGSSQLVNTGQLLAEG